jgi:hypothetical protein
VSKQIDSEVNLLVGHQFVLRYNKYLFMDCNDQNDEARGESSSSRVTLFFGNAALKFCDEFIESF